MKKVLLYLFSVLSFVQLNAQEYYTEKRSISKSFALSPTSSLEVSNKYGDIIFEIWDKDSVQIEVAILAEAKKEEAVDVLMELAVIDIEKNGSYITATTDWGAKSSFWSKSANEISRAFGSDQKMQIDYKITCPSYLAIDLRNKFGNIFLPAYTGEVRIELEHGDLRCRDMEDPRDIRVNYGKALLDKLGKGMLSMEFSELRTKNAENLSINSRKSKINVEKAKAIRFDSRNDEIYLGTVREVSGKFHFSTCEIEMLEDFADLSQSYGSLLIKELSESFSKVKVSPKKGEVTIYTSEFIDYNFSVFLKDGEEFASVPELIQITRDEKLDDGRLIEGAWGDENPNQNIIIQGENAVVKIAKL